MVVTQGMLKLASEHAGSARITDIYLQFGRMSFIVPESVDSYFRYLSKNTRAKGAQLHFEIVPIEMTCQDGDGLQNLKGWEDDRPNVVTQKAFARGCQCGSRILNVTGGLGFQLASISVEMSD
jgi:Zn finger protein HypA/HybF involved in hydrogenase expression